MEWDFATGVCLPGHCRAYCDPTSCVRRSHLQLGHGNVLAGGVRRELADLQREPVALLHAGRFTDLGGVQRAGVQLERRELHLQPVLRHRLHPVLVPDRSNRMHLDRRAGMHLHLRWRRECRRGIERQSRFERRRRIEQHDVWDVGHIRHLWKLEFGRGFDCGRRKQLNLDEHLRIGLDGRPDERLRVDQQLSIHECFGSDVDGRRCGEHQHHLVEHQHRRRGEHRHQLRLDSELCRFEHCGNEHCGNEQYGNGSRCKQQRRTNDLRGFDDELRGDDQLRVNDCRRVDDCRRVNDSSRVNDCRRADVDERQQYQHRRRDELEGYAQLGQRDQLRGVDLYCGHPFGGRGELRCDRNVHGNGGNDYPLGVDLGGSRYDGRHLGGRYEQQPGNPHRELGRCEQLGSGEQRQQSIRIDQPIELHLQLLEVLDDWSRGNDRHGKRGHHELAGQSGWDEQRGVGWS